MSTCPISIPVLLVFFLVSSRIGSTACSGHFKGNVSINCGSTRASVSRNGRKWLGDVQPKLTSLLQISGKSTTSTLTKKLALDDQIPHKTARISRNHLYGSSNPPLTWKRRLQICFDVAEGLDYLHNRYERFIFLGGIKSASIFLDEEWVAKLRDFGLSEVCPSDLDLTNAVSGRFSDLDKEYFKERKVAEKFDVCSSGVLLLEVLCARPPISPELPKEQVNLVKWATSCFTEGKLEQIVDSKLKGHIGPECLGNFVETAIACIRGQGTDQPAMEDVIESLELAINLQKAAAIDEALKLKCYDPSRTWTATNEFSFPDKILGAGICSIYKAELRSGVVVTVKRYSGRFPVNHYRNEILSVCSLRRPNIIQLHRYYIDEHRGMLFYEYMENGTLEKILLDDTCRDQLSWSVRFKIIIGIAQGVSYLHSGSCLKIIHRNLNLSSILLDKEMNPKISGFGLARIIKHEQPELSSVADGTCGYTSPKCIKSILEKEDVYRFGVLVLEIMNGQRNNEPSSGDHIVNAWKLWEEELKQFRVLELIDRSLVEELSKEEGQEAVRCFLVALLCTQHDPQQRPTMDSAVKMLLGDDLLLQEKMAQVQRPPCLESDDIPEWLADWPDNT